VVVDLGNWESARTVGVKVGIEVVAVEVIELGCLVAGNVVITQVLTDHAGILGLC